MTVNKHESFLTRLWETKDNLFHDQIIRVMRQMSLWKKVGDVILSQFWCSMSLQVLIFHYLLTCKIRLGHHSSKRIPTVGKTSNQTYKVFVNESFKINDLFWSCWYKCFPGDLKIIGLIGLEQAQYSLLSGNIYCFYFLIIFFFFLIFDTYIRRESGLPIFLMNEFYPSFI